MTTVATFPAIEVLARHWLANHATVGPLASGVHTKSPARPTYPYLTVQRIGGLPVERHRYDRARIEVHAWGADEDEASLVARTARAALHEMEGQAVEVDDDNAGWVAAVEDDLGLTWLPDTDRTPPTPRYTFAVAITARGV